MSYRLLFFLLSCNCLLGNASAAEPTADEVLDKFVGAWRIDPVEKDPAKPNQFSHELISKELKGRYLVGRDLNHDSQMKSLWFMTYDDRNKRYAWTFFNTHDLKGAEWHGKWDAASDSHISQSADLPAGWTSEGKNRFPNRDRVETTAWIKDDQGKSIFEMTFTKTRQPDDVREKWLNAWQADPTPVPELSPELKLLDRLAGTWDVLAESKKAEWTPADTRIKSKVIRTWVLDRQLLTDQSFSSDGTEGFGLFTYDTKQREYRSWWFNSEGHTSKSTGQTTAEGNVIQWRSRLPGGEVSDGSVRIADDDHHEWKIKITDGSGKVYFDCVWRCVRAK